jgi:hypothetical protein
MSQPVTPLLYIKNDAASTPHRPTLACYATTVQTSEAQQALAWEPWLPRRIFSMLALAPSLHLLKWIRHFQNTQMLTSLVPVVGRGSQPPLFAFSFALSKTITGRLLRLALVVCPLLLQRWSPCGLSFGVLKSRWVISATAGRAL